MKINKLFHWLYAFLMLLPLVVFLPTGLYYAFNEHADNGTQTATANIEYQYKYQTNEVNSVNDLVVGNVYHWDVGSLSLCLDTDPLDLYILNANYIEFNVNSYETFNSNDEYNSNLSNYLHVFIDDVYFYIDCTNNNLYCTLSCDYISFEDIDFYFTDLNTFKDYISNYYDIGSISSSTFNEIESATATIEYNNDNSIVNAMSSAWDDVWELPLFSWSGSSFLTAPFNYITVLFGIPNNSVFVYALSYWLSISIIWLVFDIVIYVPMLIHRWLDKASLS